MSKFSKGFVVGLFSGAAIGSVIGLLFAPDKGSNTRDKLSYKLSSYAEELGHLKEKLSSERDEAINDAKIQGEQVISDAQRKAEDLIAEAEELLQAIQQKK